MIRIVFKQWFLKPGGSERTNQWLIHHGTGERTFCARKEGSDAFKLSFGSCGSGVLTNSDGAVLVSKLISDKLCTIRREDSFPARVIQRQNGISEVHAEVRCKAAHKCVKLELKGQTPFYCEVYVFPIRRGPAHIFWSASWIRKLIFPDLATDNFCGRNLKTWTGFLRSLGIEDEDHFLRSHHAAWASLTN